MLRAILMLLIIATAGCAELTHLTRERDLSAPSNTSVYTTTTTITSTDEGDIKTIKESTRANPKITRDVVLIDAKQRALITTDEKFCAEPSPDALSAIASTFGVSLSSAEKTELSQSFSLSEGASSIGLRTQSIQLMRDSMYRLCEGYLSGSLTKPAYQDMFRRFQASMVSILAIEQLTGVQRAPTVALTSSAIIGAAELVSKYTDLTEQSKKKVDEAESQLAIFKAELDIANTELASSIEKNGELAAAKAEQEALLSDDNKVPNPEETKPEAQPEETKPEAKPEEAKPEEAKNIAGSSDVEDDIKKYNDYLEKVKAVAEKISQLEAANTKAQAAQKAFDEGGVSLANRKSEYDSNNKARIAALTSSAETSVSAQITNVTATPLSEKSIIEISKTVKEIVLGTIYRDSTKEVCTTIIQNLSWDKVVPAQSTAWYCLAALFNEDGKMNNVFEIRDATPVTEDSDTTTIGQGITPNDDEDNYSAALQPLFRR
jgi:hypothetical protein